MFYYGKRKFDGVTGQTPPPQCPCIIIIGIFCERTLYLQNMSIWDWFCKDKCWKSCAYWSSAMTPPVYAPDVLKSHFKHCVLSRSCCKRHIFIGVAGAAEYGTGSIPACIGQKLCRLNGYKKRGAIFFVNFLTPGKKHCRITHLIRVSSNPKDRFLSFWCVAHLEWPSTTP